MSGTKSYTITVPDHAVRMIEHLIPEGLYGSNRAAVSANLILDQLKRLKAEGAFSDFPRPDDVANSPSSPG